MKFLVTGATAFAGSHLAQFLIKEGHEVWCTSRRTNGSETELLDLLSPAEFESINWIFCDLLDNTSCLKAFEQKFDGVFHLAAQSHPPTSFNLPFYTQAVNVKGTMNLLEAMNVTQPRTRFMFCSTSEVYGAVNLQDGEKISETWPISTVNPYASSKAMIDIFLQERINNGFINSFITRAFSHTGPRRGKIFSISSDAYQIAKIITGKQDKQIQVGNLNSKRAIMDVRDCVVAYYKLMMSDAKGVFNVGADNVYTMGEILSMMLDMYNLLDVEKVIDQKMWRSIDIPVQVPDVSKLKSTIDWECKVPIETTLTDLINYWLTKMRD